MEPMRPVFTVRRFADCTLLSFLSFLVLDVEALNARYLREHRCGVVEDEERERPTESECEGGAGECRASAKYTTTVVTGEKPK